MINLKIRMFKWTFLVLSCFLCLTFQQCRKGYEPASRVILIGIDGMGISGFQEAVTPNLDELVQSGALSFKTRAVMPTVSGPNWGSHLLGAGPEQHGITNNGWTVDNHSVKAVEEDEQGYFPSLFTVIRNQLPGATMGFFYDWNALSNLYNLALIDKVEFSENFEESFKKATPWILENDPEFTFLYIGHPDGVGHSHQWGSREYIQALEDVDTALGVFFKKLKNAGMYENTHFVVVTDHGGVGYGHGGLSMEEIEIPWIISGPGVVKNKMIDQPNDVYNTASTIVYLLGLDQPYAWTGRPVLGAFMHEKISEMNTRSYVPQPKSSHTSGLFPQSEAVALSVSDPDVVIRYTLDGSDPGPNSPPCKRPILIQKTTVLRAAGFINEQSSRITEVKIKKVIPLDNITLVHLPEEKYGGKGPATLADLKIASNQYDDGEWLGFKGVDLEAYITFAERTDVSLVSLGVLRKPDSWIFLPQSIHILASVNGIDYSEIGHLNSNEIQGKTKMGRNEIVVNITPAQTKYLKVVVKNMGHCPPGHSGEGQLAWLFVDEIMVE